MRQNKLCIKAGGKLLFIIIRKCLAAVWALVSSSMGKLVMAPFDPVRGSYGLDEIGKWSIGAAYNGIAEQFKARDFLHLDRLYGF